MPVVAYMFTSLSLKLTGDICLFSSTSCFTIRMSLPRSDHKHISGDRTGHLWSFDIYSQHPFLSLPFLTLHNDSVIFTNSSTSMRVRTQRRFSGCLSYCLH